MITKDDLKKKVREDEDWIKHPRSFNSLGRYLTKAPEATDDRTIAKMLLMTEEEVETIYQEAIAKIKKIVNKKEKKK